MTLSPIPFKFPLLYIVTNMSFPGKIGQEVTEEIQLISPTDKLVKNYQVSFPVERDNQIGVIGQLVDVVISEEGKYELRVIVDGEKVYSEYIQIMKQ